jgi:glycosyltransferase involved in cell wall biosynthesis
MKPDADLSVVMPTYNHAALLPRALRAVLDQSVLPREVIVVNDASTDGTAAVLEGFVRECPRVRVLTNGRNAGAVASLLRGAAEARGRYLFFPASDDYILPGFVEKSMAVLERHPEAGLCCSYPSTFREETGEVVPHPTGWCDEPRYFNPAEVERLVGRSALIPGHASVLRRDVLEAAGGFLPELAWRCDWFAVHVMAFRAGVCHVPEQLSLWRIADTSYSNAGEGGERRDAVVNALVDRLIAPEYRDVLPAFSRSGALGYFGISVFAAAARRPDAWSPEVLSLLNCFNADEYEALSTDADPAVRRLAEFFRTTVGCEAALRCRAEAAERLLLARVRHLESAVARMERSVFWRARAALGRCGRVLGLRKRQVS